MNDHPPPDWESFGRMVMAEVGWPVDCIEGSTLFEISLRCHLIKPVEGGFDPDQHDDDEGICPEPGDPRYEWNFVHE